MPGPLPSAGGQTTHISQGVINGNSPTGSVTYLGASADGSHVFFRTLLFADGFESGG